MKFRLLIDPKTRKLFKKNEIYAISYKFLIYNYLLKQNPLFIFNLINFNYFHTFLLKNSRSRIHNYCIISGRSRGIVSFFHLSRLTFRELANNGVISGVKRAIW